MSVDCTANGLNTGADILIIPLSFLDLPKAVKCFLPTACGVVRLRSGVQGVQVQRVPDLPRLRGGFGVGRLQRQDRLQLFKGDRPVFLGRRRVPPPRAGQSIALRAGVPAAEARGRDLKDLTIGERRYSTGVPHSTSLPCAKMALRASAKAASTGYPSATAW